MRRDRKGEPHIHPGAIQVDSLAPAHLTRRFSQPAPPSELPRGSLSRPSQGLDSPFGLPSAAYLDVPLRAVRLYELEAIVSVRAPNAPRPRTRASHTSQSYTASPVCRYTAHTQKTPQSHRTSAQFGLRFSSPSCGALRAGSQVAKPCGPACGSLSPRRLSEP
jgi:hypothetical protein